MKNMTRTGIPLDQNAARELIAYLYALIAELEDKYLDDNSFYNDEFFDDDIHF